MSDKGDTGKIINIEEARRVVAEAESKAAAACNSEIQAVLKKHGFAFSVSFQGEGNQCQSIVRLVRLPQEPPKEPQKA